MTIEAALPCGPQNAGEHILGDGAARRPIAAAVHFAGNDRPSDRVLGPPVRGIQVESKEKGEQRRPLTIEVRDEPSNGGNPRRLVQQRRQAIDQAAAGDGDPMRGYDPSGVPVPHVQGFLEDLLNLPRQARAGMIRAQLARASDQVRETRLMRRLRELAIRCPPVADQAAGEGRTQETGGLGKPPTGRIA